MDRPAPTTARVIPVNWWALLGILGLIVAGVMVIVASDPRREEHTVGQHSWVTKDDVDDSGGDVELMAAVTGLGEEREPTREDREAATQLSLENWGDLRGGRDVDPGTSNPWRNQ